MTKLVRSMLIAMLAAAAVASTGLPSTAATRSYDGEWSVVIYTLRGDCNRALRYSLRINNGRVQQADQSYQAAGVVASNGSVRVVVAEGGRSANGSGRLVGNSGRGWWRTDSGECSGQWTAERRMAGY
jgi:hypothetical protein